MQFRSINALLTAERETVIQQNHSFALCEFVRLVFSNKRFDLRCY
jgi:hypothetical protein